MRTIMIKDRLKMAVRVLASQPLGVNERPQRYSSSWPTFAKSAHNEVKIADRRHIIFQPSPAEIQDIYEILDMLMLLPAFERNLVWARASGVPWALLQARYMLSRTHLNRRYRLAIEKCELALMGRPQKCS